MMLMIVMIIGLLFVGCENPSGGGKDKDTETPINNGDNPPIDNGDDPSSEPETPIYTVKFNTNGGDAVDSIPVEAGGTITLPPEPSNGIYVFFDGWFTDNTSFKNEFTSSSSVNGTITVYAKWRPYAIGETGPAGGLIFYDKGSVSNDWRYLEAAPASTEAKAAWGRREDVLEFTPQDIGAGKGNTRIIVEYYPNGGYAANICDELNVNGFDDWFLPSLGELGFMYDNLKVAELGEFKSDRYFSSSTMSNDGVRYLEFSSGNKGYGYLREAEHRFRAIRQF
jgi:uncharacterized repeat protein (TIGR02543 family)